MRTNAGEIGSLRGRGARLVALLGLAVLGACSVLGSSLDHFTEGGDAGTGQGGCSGTLTQCETTCVDTTKDPNHCGACDKVCPDPQVCDTGSCADSCSAGKTACDRFCVDTQTDPEHCGDCKTFCTKAEACASGKCATSCPSSQTQCGSSCVDTSSDDQHCGACNSPCGSGKKCANSKCEVSCSAAQKLCDGACVDTQTNQNNCGACGKACKAGETCNAGACKIACPGSQVECSGACADLQKDFNNCGACAASCKVGELCGNGKCDLVCPTGQQNCGGACSDTQVDAKNCGTCGTACAADQECSAGKCIIACKTKLNQVISDGWGYNWDGLERAATPFAQAKQTCEAFGGRLPTASELYRVSATQSAQVGQTSHTNFLWSAVPHSAGNHVRVRLSDANTSNDADTGSLNYRCVCPPALPSSFVGGNCFGPPGQGCYGQDTEGKRYNMDVQDRAPLSKGAAMWECAFHRSHLPKPIQYAEAIQQGIGPGSNTWLHTADEVHYSYDALVSWKDPTSWVFQYIGALNAVSWSAATDFRPFRCVGVNYDAGTHPVAVADEFVGPLGGYKGETKDNAGQGFAAALDACFGRGGHLPTATELGELVEQGLPGGTNAWLFTSDQVGFNGTQFLVSVKRWTGVDVAHQYAYSTDLSWDYKTTASYPFRCIYYPVDKTYAGPAASDCAGGCFSLPLPGTSGAKMWLDNFNHPPGTVTEAISACRKLGGHLASERDLTEGIRQGLPNGSTNWVATSDAEVGQANGILVGSVKWLGVDKQFTDQYSTYSTWVWAYQANAYRCVWTNELR